MDDPDGIPCMWMRGGSSKGGYFLARDLPEDPRARDALLLRIMGSPDPRQIDGMGGADPLTSKVAIVSASKRPGVDVDYLFLQVFVDQPLVSDAQNCGNILAGVGPFAIERGLVAAQTGETPVTVHMLNSGKTAVLRVATPGGRVTYAGQAQIDGVPGQAAPVPVTFRDTAGSMCGALLPTGRARDRVCGLEVTMIDNGMPCVVLRASDLGLSGDEPPEALEADQALRDQIEALRLACGPLMALGDVAEASVPKMCLVSPARAGGTIATRSFIPHRCHKAIGVLGAVSVATACLLPDSPAHALASLDQDTGSGQSRSQDRNQDRGQNPAVQCSLKVEHPSGSMTVLAEMAADGTPAEVAILRSARKLADGLVWP